MRYSFPPGRDTTYIFANAYIGIEHEYGAHYAEDIGKAFDAVKKRLSHLLFVTPSFKNH